MGTNRWDQYAPLPLRLVIGAAFLYHGIPKLLPDQGHLAFVTTLTAMGIPAPDLSAWIVALIETLGGAALLAGFWTRSVAGALFIDMAVALVKVHWAQGFNFIHVVGHSNQGPVYGLPGYEVNLLYIAGLASLIFSGGGAWSAGGGRRGIETELSRQTRTQTVIRAEPESVPLDVEI